LTVEGLVAGGVVAAVVTGDVLAITVVIKGKSEVGDNDESLFFSAVSNR
jgi:hypothetical protein